MKEVRFTEKKALEDMVNALWAAVAPAEDEPNEVKSLKIRAKLVARLQLALDDGFTTAEESLENAVAHLKVVNPDVKFSTAKIGYLHYVANKLIFIPDFLKKSDGAEEVSKPNREEPIQGESAQRVSVLEDQSVREEQPIYKEMQPDN